MKFQEMYSYAKQPNGLYTIKHVPIFKLFVDEGGEHGQVTEQDAQEILQNFSENAKAGTYPRIFVGHHTDPGVGNQEGVGFIDNLQVEGDTFFADFVEIPQKTIDEMRTRHAYPYRSVEYNGDIKEITGLALLDSRKPFFTLPILTLAEKEGKLSSFQSERYKIRKFQFQKGDRKMPDEINKKEGETEDLEGTNDKMVENGGSDSLNQCQFKYQELSDGIGAKLDNIMGAISSIAETLQTLLESESEEADMQGREGVGEVPEKIEEPEEENQAGKAPGSVAMQFQKVNNRILALEKENRELKKLQDPSRMTQFAGSYAPNKMVENTILQKFQGNPTVLRAAKLAMQSFYDSTKFKTGESLKQFQQTWGKTPEKFVNFFAEMEDAEPGYTERELR